MNFLVNPINFLLCFLLVVYSKGFILYDAEFVTCFCLSFAFITILKISEDSFKSNINNIILETKTFYLKELNEYKYLLSLVILEISNIHFFYLKFWHFYLHFISEFTLYLSYRFYLLNLYFNILVEEKLLSFLLIENIIYSRDLNKLKLDKFSKKVKSLLSIKSKSLKNSLNPKGKNFFTFK